MRLDLFRTYCGFILETPKHLKTKALFRFGTFTLDASEQRLWRKDEPIHLKPKQFELLHYFVTNAGRVAKKNDILDAVWPDTFVEESTLARNVSWLRKLLEADGEGKQFIETVPKVGYLFTAKVTQTDGSELIVVEEQAINYVRIEETISQTTRPARRFAPLLAAALAGVVLAVLAVSGFSIYRAAMAENGDGPIESATDGRPTVIATSDRRQVKIGSIVNLQSSFPNDGSYLDAWGAVWNKPEFRQVPTEKMFVSTHADPNRDNGSGSWEIVSASGKSKGEPLEVGDRIHLKNMYKGAGFLDTCGWVEHLRVFDDFSDQSAAVFTTKSSNRDNGSGTWTIRSASQANGNPVFEGDGIALESDLNIDDTGKVHIAGFLNITGSVKDIPSFAGYNGSRLVFTKSISHDQPVPDNWTITISNIVPE